MHGFPPSGRAGVLRVAQKSSTYKTMGFRPKLDKPLRAIRDGCQVTNRDSFPQSYDSHQKNKGFRPVFRQTNHETSRQSQGARRHI